MSALRQLAGRRILFLNWRDLGNPAAGGAEDYAEQIARRFADAGVKVTLFTSEYPGGAAYDWSRGYLVARSGSRLGVYLAAARHLRQHARSYDAIVDCQNGIPFFAPLWARGSAAVVCVVHHVHQDQFGMYFPWPASLAGRVLEGRATRAVYSDAPFVAVSPSTREQMRHRLGLRQPIHIVPNGVDPLPAARAARATSPVIAVVTRLVPHKRLNLLVEAVPVLLRRWPSLQVDIAGTGPARAALRAQVRELGLEEHIRLPGRVSDQARSDLLGRAWVTVAPSLAEGWGLTVLEANTLGTPAVAYDVPGLRDSVRDGRTGWLVPAGRGLETALSNALSELADPAGRQAVSERARAWAGRFTWDATAERLASVVVSEIARRLRGSPSRRHPVDLATVAEYPPDDAGGEPGLRVTDAVIFDESGPHALLGGCDEAGAVRALSRTGIRPARLSLATTTQVLCATADEPR
jgi:glycosyltransferase involved in cell wall biosynthesis